MPATPQTIPICPVSVIVPACKKPEALAKTLMRIQECQPAPDEILVHADGSDPQILSLLEREFPSVKVLQSSSLLGPGGSRNKLVKAARNELVANFDDDSFPATKNYFARVIEDARLFPEAAIISAASHEAEWQVPGFLQIAVASGCGCVFRKSWFERTTGFVPLRIAYNMEEVDVGLKLHAIGGAIVHDPDLRVIHDHPWRERVDPEINGAVLANTALLAYLRYPWWLMPLGFLQVFLLLVRLASRGAFAGLWNGLQAIPSYLLEHRHFREPKPGLAVLSWLLLKRHPCRPAAQTACRVSEMNTEQAAPR